MNESKKIYDYYQNYMKDAQRKHETDIEDILNGDDGTPLGDWTEREVSSYSYALSRSTTVYKAIQILKEEQSVGCLK